MSKKISQTKICIAEFCTNRSDSIDKIFISVPAPAERERRNAWLRACELGQNDVSPKSHLYVCEDHFNMEVDCLNLADYKSGRKKKILMDKNVIPHRFLRQDVSHSTDDVVTDVMKTTASISKQTDGIYSQATCDVDLSCVKESALAGMVEAFPWPIVIDTVGKADKASATTPICLKNVGVNTDNCLKVGVRVRSRAVQTNAMDFVKHGLLSNVSCSPFGSPWKVSNIERKASPVKLGNSKRKLNIPSEEEEVMMNNTSVM